MKNKILIFGNYFNALSVAKHFKSANYYFVDSSRGLLTNDKFLFCEKSSESVVRLVKRFSDFKIYIIPTSDQWCEILESCIEELNNVKFFMSKGFSDLSGKIYQINLMKKLKLPVPKSVSVKEGDLAELEFPVIVKPVKDDCINILNRKNVVFKTENDYLLCQDKLIHSGQALVVSEIIDSDVDGIYSYACYKNKSGQILNEWTGQKNIQYPNEFGVFAASEMVHELEVLEFGRKIAQEVEYEGFIQPEFKRCKKTQKLYLMEINLRPMMWHSVALMNGINIYDGFLPSNMLTSSSWKYNKLYFFPHVLFLILFGSLKEKKAAISVLFDSDYGDIAFSGANKFKYFVNIIKVIVSGFIKKSF